MEHAISEIIKIFTTMIFILLLVGMVIMGKHLSDVNSFKEYVNTQIERNGGYTQTVKTNVEKMNKDSFNNMFVVYEPDSNTPKKIEEAPFGEIVNYEIHSDIPIPFTTAGTIKIPIAFKGQAVSRIRDSADLVKHTAYSWSADGKDRFYVAGGTNLIVQSDLKPGWFDQGTGGLREMNGPNDFHSDNYIATNGETVFTFSSPDYTFKGSIHDPLLMYDSNKNYLGCQLITSPTQTLSKSNVAYIRFSINISDEGGTPGKISDWLANHRYKLEKGSIATSWSPAPSDPQPKYIGTYTDKSKTDSQDPSKYTWKLNPDYHE